MKYTYVLMLCSVRTKGTRCYILAQALCWVYLKLGRPMIFRRTTKQGSLKSSFIHNFPQFKRSFANMEHEIWNVLLYVEVFWCTSIFRVSFEEFVTSIQNRNGLYLPVKCSQFFFFTISTKVSFQDFSGLGNYLLICNLAS